jgi:arylsulfatase A-like enzyme
MCVDHGVQLPRAKTTCYDAGRKVAWLLRGPGIPAGTRVGAMTAHVDFLPTVLDLADVAVPENVQGKSLAAHARGQADEEVNECVFGHFVEVRRMVRTRDFKLIRNFREADFGGGSSVGDLAPEAEYPGGECPHVELYDLREDPNEFHNVAESDDYGDVRRELDARLWDFLLEHDDFVVHEPVRSDWQRRTRRDLEEHLLQTARFAQEDR